MVELEGVISTAHDSTQKCIFTANPHVKVRLVPEQKPVVHERLNAHGHCGSFCAPWWTADHWEAVSATLWAEPDIDASRLCLSSSGRKEEQAAGRNAGIVPSQALVSCSGAARISEGC